jgi:hypothetical protein
MEKLPLMPDGVELAALRRSADSYIAGIVTSRFGTRGTYNIAYGSDGLFRNSGNDYLDFHLSQICDDSMMNRPFSLDPTRIGINRERRTVEGLGYRASLARSGPDFPKEISLCWPISIASKPYGP